MRGSADRAAPYGAPAIGAGFRRIVEDDYRAICDLVATEEELFLFYAQGRFPLTVGQVGKLVARRMEPTVMDCDGSVAGFGNFYGYREGRSVVIGNVIIDPALRGRGLGRRFVQRMIDLAFDRYDLPSVKIHVYNRNLPALALYGELGFRPCAMKVKRDYAGERVMLFTLRLKRAARRSTDARAGFGDGR